MKSLLVFLVILLLAGAAFGQASLTGNDYRGWPDAYRNFYTLGLIAGLQIGGAWGKEGSDARDCVRGKTGAQIKAIIEKFLSDNPGQWHLSLTVLVNNALVPACP